MLLLLQLYTLDYYDTIKALSRLLLHFGLLWYSSRPKLLVATLISIQDQAPIHTMIHHCLAVQTVAGWGARALRPGVTASRDSFGRALLRVYKSICLAICEVVSESAGSVPASRHQVVPLGTGGKSLGQVERCMPFTTISTLSGVELEA